MQIHVALRQRGWSGRTREKTRVVVYLFLINRQHCAQQSAGYLIYSEADSEDFRPAGATRCTDGGEIWHGGEDRRSPPPCQISPQSVQR